MFSLFSRMIQLKWGLWDEADYCMSQVQGCKQKNVFSFLFCVELLIGFDCKIENEKKKTLNYVYHGTWLSLSLGIIVHTCVIVKMLVCKWRRMWMEEDNKDSMRLSYSFIYEWTNWCVLLKKLKSVLYKCKYKLCPFLTWLIFIFVDI